MAEDEILREYGATPPDSSPVPNPAADERDEDAFSRYVIAELAFLHRVALSLTANATDAEDLVQETLLASYRGIGHFDGPHPRAWLCTVMRNAEAKRHRRRRPELLSKTDEARAVRRNDLGAAAASAEAIVVDSQFDATVAASLAALSEAHRRVIELVDLDGLSYAEAAEVLGVPIGTVMSRLHRGRSRIRKRLVAEGLAPRRRMR